MDDISKKNHSLTVDNRSRGEVSAVDEVLSFGENELCLSTSLGRLTVVGKDLKIVNFLSDQGKLTFSGSVSSVRYDEKKPPLIKRIFK